MAKRSGKSGISKSARPVTPRRQAAIDAYKEAFQRDPPRAMSIKQMTAKAGQLGALKAPTNDSHYGITTGSDAAKSKWNTTSQSTSRPVTHTPAAPIHIATPSMTSRIRAAMPSGQTVNTGLMVAGVAAAAGRGFHEAKAQGKSTGEAVVAGATNAAIPAAIAAAPAIAKGAGHVASGAFAVSGALIEAGAGSITDWMLSFPLMKAGLASGAVGVAAKGVEIGAKVVGRVATPAMAAYGAYQGAKEAQGKGENMTVGAARGVVRAFDPSTIFMRRGVGERVFDAGVNAASNKMAEFKRANANYAASHMSGHDGDGPYNVGTGKRGFGNPANQAAAQKAKGNRYEGPTG